MTDEEFVLIKQTVRRLIDLDLDAYKEDQMRRRLDNFILHKGGGADVAGFCRNIAGDKELLFALSDMLTINVTEFFRDPEAFNLLKSRILPELLEHRPNLRIWSAGCSRGAEAYTVAMLLEELGSAGRHTLLATDFDSRALAVAEQGGPFPPNEVRNLPVGLREKYLSQTPRGFQLTQRPRQGIRFRRQNLLSDPFDRDFDLILCRNVMIYFTPEARAVLLSRFRDSLRPGGLLLLGSTEALLANDAAGYTRTGLSLYQKTTPAAVLSGAA